MPLLQDDPVCRCAASYLSCYGDLQQIRRQRRLYQNKPLATCEAMADFGQSASATQVVILILVRADHVEPFAVIYLNKLSEKAMTTVAYEPTVRSRTMSSLPFLVKKKFEIVCSLAL